MSQSHCTALSLAFVTVADWQLNTPWFHVIPRVNYFFQLVSRHLIWTLLSNEQQVVEVFHGQSLPQSITHSVHRRKRSFNTYTSVFHHIHSWCRASGQQVIHTSCPGARNRLLKELRQPVVHSSLTYPSDSTTSLLALSPSLFHSKLKTHLFRQSFPP